MSLPDLTSSIKLSSIKRLNGIPSARQLELEKM